MAANAVIFPQSLNGIRYFSALKLEAREQIARLCSGRRYTTGELVVSQMETVGEVFFIINGTARVTNFSRFGRETTLQLLTAGDCFGELAAIDGGPSTSNLIADSELFVATLHEQQFRKIIFEHPEITNSFMADLVRNVRDLAIRIVEYSTLSVAERVRAEIVRLAEQGECAGNRAIVCHPPTHFELAARVSTHREAVTRELNALKKRGLMRCNRQIWHIDDLDSLRCLSGLNTQMATPRSQPAKLVRRAS